MKYNEYGYPKIESERQYWKEFNEWKKKLDKISFRKMYSQPYKLIEVLQEGAEREVISWEYVNQKINRMNKESRMPQEFKDDVSKGKEYVKKKAKDLFKKGGYKDL